MARSPEHDPPGADFFMAALWDAAKPVGIDVPGYTILSELSRGGMGVVYHAVQTRPEREVALKVLLSHLAEEPEMLARFQLEARAMATLDHPGILPVYEVGEAEGVPFFSMKLATGGSLSDRLGKKPMPPKEAAALIIQLTRAVHHAHQHGVLHRDLKPGNFLFLEDGRACVSDFGLAKLSTQDHGPLTRTESFFGTPHYMPPEVAAGSVGNATVAGDLYSMGAVFYECLTGRRPHAAKDSVAALLRSIADDPVKPPTVVIASLPRDLSVICMKALERRPADRYATLAEFADDVERWMEGRPVRARPAGKLEMAWRWAQRHPLSAGLIVALVVVTLAGTVALAISYGKARSELHASLIEQARSGRLLGEPGHRRKAMDRLQKAAEIAPSPVIRDEAAALLARPDLSSLATIVSRSPEAWPPDGNEGDRVVGRRVRRGTDHGLTFHESGTARLWRKGAPDPVKEWTPPAGRAIAGDLSPDGNSVILAETEQGVIVENLTNSSPARVLVPLGPRVIFVAIHPAGGKAALARDDGLEMLSLTGQSKHYGSAQARCAPAWSADGARLAIATGDRHEAVILAANDLAVCATATLTGLPQVLAFHPGGSLIAVASDDGVVALCESATGTRWTSLPFAARKLEFSPDGSELLATTANNDVHGWRVSLPVAFHEWPESPRNKADGPVYSMALSPDGSRLLTVTMGCVAVWSVPEQRQTGFRLLENQRIDAPASAFWLTDNTVLLQVPGGLERLKIDASGKPGASERLPKVPGTTVLKVQPDGGWVVKVKDEDGNESCETWPAGDAAAARPVSMPEKDSGIITAMHPVNGQKAALTSGDIIEVRLANGTEMHLTLPLNPSVRALQFSSDGQRLLMLTRQHRLFSWDLVGLSAALDGFGL